MTVPFFATKDFHLGLLGGFFCVRFYLAQTEMAGESISALRLCYMLTGQAAGGKKFAAARQVGRAAAIAKERVWNLNYAQIRRSRRRWSCGGSGSRVNTVI